MAAGTVQLADVIVPEIFTPYVQQYTERKSRLINSGLVTMSPFLNNFLAGAGVTVNVPSFKDLDDDVENVSTDQAGTSSPKKIGSAQEIAVRLSRNNSWASYNLVEALISKDPMTAIGERVGDYWVRRAQALFIATMTGVFADNAAVPAGGDTHTQNDLTFDIKGVAYSAGVTDFSASAFIDATLTMGDSMESLGTVAVHSIVYGRMQKNNLIQFEPASDAKIMIPTFLGREVIVDDSLPFTGGVFESWLFGAGAVGMGMGSPAMPTELDRLPAVGNGGGADVLHNRVEWCMHPVGHAYIGAAPAGGPSNAATANNLAAAGSWSRVYSERKQIKMARLITREF